MSDPRRARIEYDDDGGERGPLLSTAQVLEHQIRTEPDVALVVTFQGDGDEAPTEIKARPLCLKTWPTGRIWAEFADGNDRWLIPVDDITELQRPPTWGGSAGDVGAAKP